MPSGPTQMPVEESGGNREKGGDNVATDTMAEDAPDRVESINVHIRDGQLYASIWEPLSSVTRVKRLTRCRCEDIL